MMRRKRHSPRGIRGRGHRIGAFRFGGFGDILDVRVALLSFEWANVDDLLTSTRLKPRMMKVSKLLVEDEEAVDAGQDLEELE
jgi:hypothetical protein